MIFYIVIIFMYFFFLIIIRENIQVIQIDNMDELNSPGKAINERFLIVIHVFRKPIQNSQN